MADFLPADYEVKDSSDQYMKFASGENRFRILSSPIIGQEWWTELKGQRIVHRRRSGQSISPNELGEDPIKQFWMMVVFDYKTNKVKILEITQKRIMRTLQNLSRSEDWGNPKGTNGYDIVVTREGDDLATKYEVLPKPPKKLTPGIMELYADMNIDLEAIWDNGDPFNSNPSTPAQTPPPSAKPVEMVDKEVVDPNDIPDDIDALLGGK